MAKMDEVIDGVAPSLANRAHRRIEDMIVTGALPPGAMISENGLREQLNVGRTPIREALQRLSLEGFVDIHPSRGVQVTAVDFLKQLELLELRRFLEDLAVQLAVERATPAERSHMRGLAEAVMEAASLDEKHYLEVNRCIHEAIAVACKNQFIERTIRYVYSLSRRFWYAYIKDADSYKEGARMHAQTLRAIADRDGNQAAVSVRKLLDFLESLSRRAIEEKFGR
jgi:DNA-binding GntR family transcriptional regulator